MAALPLAVYAACYQAGYVEYDDPQYILDNPHVNTGLTWVNVCWAFSLRAHDNGIWGPLLWLSHMLDWQLFGIRPLGPHLHSVLLHAANAVLLFLLLYRGTGCRTKSFLVATLFAFHPLGAENVAWLSERKSLLCMFWSLLAVAAYGWYARRPGAGRYLCVAALFVMSLLAKPMAVTLPAVFLLLDDWPLRRWEGKKQRWIPQGLRLLAEKLPLFALSAFFSWIAVLSQRASGAIGRVPLSERLMNALASYVFYIEKMFWPARLTYFYPLRASTLSARQSFACGAFLLAVTLLALLLRGRRHLAFGWLLYLGTLLPVIGLVQVGSAAHADRYAYLPLIGLFIILVWELDALASRLRLPNAARAAACLMVLAALSCATYVQAGYWRDDLTLFQHAHDVTQPPDARIETNVASALTDRGRFDEALIYYRRAAALEPAAFFTRLNLGYAYVHARDIDAAATAFREALPVAHTSSERARALQGLALACAKAGNRSAARDVYRELMALEPENATWKARLQGLRP
ncbi:MAG: hypothetical protein P4M01_11820 [Acidobacteriota bacterium]|nr:hypothetical protein [Acidobacteriota bacterium]